MDAFWTYQESIEDVEVKHDVFRIMESQEQMRKRNVNSRYKERENILNIIMSCNSPESPLVFPINFNEVHHPIDSIMQGRKLPEKGKLVEAMAVAPPLLQHTLLLPQPLPRWNNPPSLQMLKMVVNPPEQPYLKMPSSFTNRHSLY